MIALVGMIDLVGMIEVVGMIELVVLRVDGEVAETLRVGPSLETQKPQDEQAQSIGRLGQLLGCGLSFMAAGHVVVEAGVATIEGSVRPKGFCHVRPL
jgi:hypothetical protein